MQYKQDLKTREATQEQKQSLKFPRNRFQLLSVDGVQEWTIPNSVGRHYHCRKHQKHILITIKCKKCGTIKQTWDRKDISCKIGPCNDKKWVDRTGQRYGSLVALSYQFVPLRHGAKPKWYWRCKCDCGNETLACANSLQLHTKLHCQLCSRKLSAEAKRLPNQGSDWKRMYRYTRRNGQIRNYQFNLPYQEFVELSKQPCYYCGQQPVQNSLGVKANGIDRTDNTQGYISGNCVPCCKVCNRMKMDQTQEQFYRKVLQVVKYRHLQFNDQTDRSYTQACGNSSHLEQVKRQSTLCGDTQQLEKLGTEVANCT